MTIKTQNITNYILKNKATMKRKFKNRTNKGKMLYIRDIAMYSYLFIALAYFTFMLVMAVINFVK